MPSSPGPPLSAPPPPYRLPGGAALGGLLGTLDRLGTQLGRDWVRAGNTLAGLLALLPWVAPICAAAGAWFLADPIYTLYLFLCHQLPERSGFLFGYQVANCFRCSALYGSIFATGLVYAAARRGRFGGRLAWMLRPITWLRFGLLLVPIAIDGLTHLLGVRDDNAWFDHLTGGQFGSFSVGDGLGTLNWWLRIISGLLFGYAVIRLLYPWLAVVLDHPTYHRPVAPPLQSPERG